MKYTELVIGKRYIAMTEYSNTVEGVFLKIRKGNIQYPDLIDFQTDKGFCQLDTEFVDWHFTEVLPGEIEVL